MPTAAQFSKKKKTTIRIRKKHYNRTKHLNGCPQKKAICVKVYITKPKKPNSALRKIAKVALGRTFKARKILVAVPGQGHSLQKFSVVMVRGGRARDMPGVRYKLMRGKYDFVMPENIIRKHRRSFYGLPKPEIEFLKNKEIIPLANLELDEETKIKNRSMEKQIELRLNRKNAKRELLLQKLSLKRYKLGGTHFVEL